MSWTKNCVQAENSGGQRDISGAEGQSFRIGNAVEYLVYSENTNKRSGIPSRQQYNSLHHGTIKGIVTFYVAEVQYSYSFTRNVHQTRANNSCGFICLETGAKLAENDDTFWKELMYQAPVAAERLKGIASLSHGDDLECSKFRKHVCQIMLDMPSDKCSPFWDNGPPECDLLYSKSVAHAYGFSVSDTDATRGQLWAIALLNPSTQLDEGYCKVLQHHLEGNVGFLVLQKRMWTDTERRRATRRNPVCALEGPLYGHAGVYDTISRKACAIWPMLHIVCDELEHGTKNHFEVLTAENVGESSIFMLSQHKERVKLRNGTLVSADQPNNASIWLDDDSEVSSQSNNLDCFSRMGQDKSLQHKVSGGHGQADQIGEFNLGRGSQISSAADETAGSFSDQYQKGPSLPATNNVPLSIHAQVCTNLDHRIGSYPVIPGNDLMRDSRQLTDMVRGAAELLRLKLGWDLIRVCGAGSYGTVIQVCTGKKNFAVKIGTRAYDSCQRLGVLVEAAIMNFAYKQSEHVGIFALMLETGCGWDSSGAALIRVAGQRIAAVAMELADSSARGIWKRMGERFRAGGHEGLLQDLQSTLQATVQVIVWMHEMKLAHGDLKPDNMLLKKLPNVPDDWRIAYCTVEGATYQIILCDWGHARWSGCGGQAIHVFSHEAKDINSLKIAELAASDHDIEALGLQRLQKDFGFAARKALCLPHPGEGTAWVKAPESFCKTLCACDGLTQRSFDQSGDIWAVGAICARVCAAPLWPSSAAARAEASENWRSKLYEASRIAESRRLHAEEYESKRRKLASFLHFHPRAARIARAVGASSLKPENHNDQWIVTMASNHYPDDVWPLLHKCIASEESSGWKSLFEFMQGLLAYNRTLRFSAKQALHHPFLGPNKF